MKKVIIAGALFGLIAPIVGLGIVLTYSSIIGKLLLAPFILITLITDIPIGEYSIVMKIIGLALSILLWPCVFVLVAKLYRKISYKRDR